MEAEREWYVIRMDASSKLIEDIDKLDEAVGAIDSRGVVTRDERCGLVYVFVARRFRDVLASLRGVACVSIIPRSVVKPS